MRHPWLARAVALLGASSCALAGERDLRVDAEVGLVLVRALEGRMCPCPAQPAPDRSTCETARDRYLEEAYAHLVAQPPEVSDPALVALERFYVGESFGERVSLEITRRGPRMLPYLAAALGSELACDRSGAGGSIELPESTVRESLEYCVSAIRAGKVLGD